MTCVLRRPTDYAIYSFCQPEKQREGEAVGGGRGTPPPTLLLRGKSRLAAAAAAAAACKFLLGEISAEARQSISLDMQDM